MRFRNRVRRVWSKIFNLLRHGPRRWWLVTEAGFFLAREKAYLAFLPFSSYKKRLASSPHAESDCKAPLSREQLAEVVWAVDRLSQMAPRALNCLPRALAVQGMLRRRKSEGTICFGVRKTEQGLLTAHAWVEINDEVIVGAVPQLDQYARLPSWPG